MAIRYGNRLGKQILDALGIDATNVRRLELTCDVSEASMLTLHTYVRDEGSDDMVEVLRRYTVTEDES
jgi:hypothetical protein